ncbi:uncharacterized protein LOC106171433 [Lingula anatina]|uniref:Uncharacterized protein LOC106171433 n=1 Tax=Lingula anatina TaxID=7574 RepID=A0A2R2MSJ9_LINAN|nr:uncharacterized protein LOC106171433 [Lingula anatina]|eukprot:XP_023932977.1 uncharacterized protein LOC106171433 [Lingula anatina]
MEVVKIVNYFFIFLVYQLNFSKTQAQDVSLNVDCFEGSTSSHCQLNMTEESRQQINSVFANNNTRFVRFNPIVRPYYSDEFWRNKNRDDKIGKYFWVWADGDTGRRYLSLRYNFVEMSLWTLSPGVEKINIDLHEVQQGCWGILNVTEQFCTIAALFLNTVHEKAVTQHHLQNSVVCYNTLDLTNYTLSSYQCSSASDVPKIHFSSEESSISKFNVYKWVLIAIALYFSPFIFVSFLPKRFTVRFSPEWLCNMGKFEISGPETKTPLSELLSLAPEDWVSSIIVVFFIYPFAHIPIFYVEYINMKYYTDCTHAVSPFFWVSFGIVFIVTLYRTWISSESFEDWRSLIKSIWYFTNIVFTGLHWMCPCERVTPDTEKLDFVSNSLLGDYISLQHLIIKFLLNAINFIKFIGIHLNIRRHTCKSFCISFLVAFLGILVGLPIFFILLYLDMMLIVIRWSQHSNANIFIQLFIYIQTLGFIFYVPYVFVLFVADLISVVTLTLVGVIINHDIVLKYITLILSVFYYIWEPFHAVQKKYRELKAMIFKECSTTGLKYIRHAPIHTTDGSDSHVQQNYEVLPMSDFVINTDTSARASLLQDNSEKEVCDYGNVQAANSQQSPTPEQVGQQYILLYTSDDRGWERIPKDLWMSIYKQLLPLDVCIAKACINSIAAVAMVIFLILAVMDFRNVSELQLSGQGIVSFITASIPKLVLGFINTELDKDALKRSWEITVRKTVEKYIKDNEIPDQTGVE